MIKFIIKKVVKIILIIPIVTGVLLTASECKIQGKRFTATCPKNFVLANIPGQAVTITRNSDREYIETLMIKEPITKLEWHGDVLHVYANKIHKIDVSSGKGKPIC